MYKATLVKGKTYSIDKYFFDISDINFKSQIISENFVDLLIRSNKFKIEKIIETKYQSLVEIIVDPIKAEKIIKSKLELRNLKIVFILHHISKSEGYGCICYGLMKKYPTIALNTRDGLELKNSLSTTFDKISKDSYIIQVNAGDLYKNYKNIYKKSVGFTMFETTKLSKHWPEVIHETCDILMVPSKEVKKVFINSGVKIPIYVVLLWADDCYQYFERPERDLFKFLWLGILNQWNRKGGFEAIEAFKQEFKTEQDVRFIIKSSHIALTPEKINQILEDKRIRFIKEVLDLEKLNEVYKEADCFVYPTHAEGFGLPPLEAMATGLPIIVTDWMGCKEFAKEQICYPIKVNKLEKALYPKAYGDVGQWAHINIKDIRRLMRYIYENRKEAKEKGKLAAQYVNEHFRFKNFDNNIRVILNLKKRDNYEVQENKVSIIMAVKDNLNYLKQCIKSIYKYTKIEFELIIIDNDSNKEVKYFLKKLKSNVKNIKIITNSRNMNFPYGYNQAIQIAKYDYMCMLDIDTIVTPNWLTKMLFCMKENKDCGICCPSQSYLKGMIYAPFVRNQNIDIIEDVANFSKTLENKFEEREIFTIYGYCHLVRRKVFEDIGVYDWKRYYGLAANDTDLFWRATLKGYKLYWVKGAYVHHFHSKIKESLGIDAVKIVEKGHIVFKERQKYPENYFVENDVMLRNLEQGIGIIN